MDTDTDDKLFDTNPCNKSQNNLTNWSCVMAESASPGGRTIPRGTSTRSIKKLSNLNNQLNDIDFEILNNNELIDEISNKLMSLARDINSNSKTDILEIKNKLDNLVKKNQELLETKEKYIKLKNKNILN